MVCCGWKNLWRTLLFIFSGILTAKAKPFVISRAIQIADRVALWAGFAGTLIGFIGILSHLHTFDNVKGMSKALAASLITILYAICIKIVLYPMQLSLQKKP